MYQVPAVLSDHNDLEQLKRQAKELHKALEAGDPTALDLAAKHMREAPAGPRQLTTAQLLLARHHGHESWARLRAHVERVNLRRFLEAVRKSDVEEARNLLHVRPEMAHMDTAENDEHRAIHHAVLRRDEPMVRLLMKAGSDARKGIYPHRDATTALVLAQERGFDEIVHAIEEEEAFRREDMSCPNATVSPAQDQLGAHIRAGREAEAITMLEADPGLARACDREGGTPLHVACEAGALAVIDWLLEHHASPRKADLKGRSPLERAVQSVNWKWRARREKFPEMARRLMRHGAIVTPMIASALGDLEELRKAHARGVQGLVDAHALSVAAAFGHLEALRLLLDLGLDPNERGRVPGLEEEVPTWGHPLWLAAAFGEIEMATLLLERGADPLGQVYASGSAVDRAYGARDEAMIALLAKHGGRPTADTIGIYRDVAAAKAMLAGECTEEQIASLLWAGGCGGSPEIVAMALERLPWAPDHPRWHTMLGQPIRQHNHGPVSEHPECFDRTTYPECLRLIIAHGVDINAGAKLGHTLMHDLAAAGTCWGIVVMTEPERLEFARIALAAKPDLTRRDLLLQSTPLAWACRWGKAELASLLLEHGARAHEPEAEPWATPLAWAEKMRHPEIAKMLRDRLSPAT